MGMQFTRVLPYRCEGIYSLADQIGKAEIKEKRKGNAESETVN
jgi:hypothetical protein